MTPIRFIVTETVRVLSSMLTQIRVSGVENLPKTGPMILTPNHLTHFDVFPIQFSIDRPIFFMAKAELFKNPVLDFIYRELGAFPVKRGERDEWAIRHAREILQRGMILGIFPEGTRSKGDGLRPAKTGAARLALNLNCPILPVALFYTEKMLIRFPRRTQIQLCFGAPIYPRPEETVLNLSDRYMFALAEMLPPGERGVYSHRPEGF